MRVLTSDLDACLEIAAEMRAVADNPAADITPADRRALVILAAELERVAMPGYEIPVEAHQVDTDTS